MPLHAKLSLFAYVISGEQSANRPKQLRNDAFHVKTSQSAKTQLDPANENRPKFDIRPFCTKPFNLFQPIYIISNYRNMNPDSFLSCCDLYRCVEHLLHGRNRANASKRDKQGYSPVHYAAARGHKLALEMVHCTVYIYHIRFLLFVVVFLF